MNAKTQRFVLLKHDWPFPHYDFMLELESSLQTWRIERMPDTNSQSMTLLDNHRKDYLEFEGKLSGDRGSVTRIDSGSYQALQWESASILIELNGIQCKGVYQLTAVSKETWSIIQIV